MHEPNHNRVSTAETLRAGNLVAKTQRTAAAAALLQDRRLQIGSLVTGEIEMRMVRPGDASNGS